MTGDEFYNNRTILRKSREQVAIDLEVSYDTVKRYDRRGAPGAVKWYFKCHGID